MLLKLSLQQEYTTGKTDSSIPCIGLYNAALDWIEELRLTRYNNVTRDSWAMTRDLIWGILLIVLSILDAYLTGVALEMGATEFNPVILPEYRANMWLKGLVTAGIVGLILFFDKGKLLKWLNVVMFVVVIWNYLSIAVQRAAG